MKQWSYDSYGGEFKKLADLISQARIHMQETGDMLKQRNKCVERIHSVHLEKLSSVHPDSLVNGRFIVEISSEESGEECDDDYCYATLIVLFSFQ